MHRCWLARAVFFTAVVTLSACSRSSHRDLASGPIEIEGTLTYDLAPPFKVDQDETMLCLEFRRDRGFESTKSGQGAMDRAGRPVKLSGQVELGDGRRIELSSHHGVVGPESIFQCVSAYELRKATVVRATLDVSPRVEVARVLLWAWSGL
jgi:hypothetical protein